MIMEIIGFILSGCLMVLLTVNWIFVFLYDGAFGGKRNIPLLIMFMLLVLLGYLWSLLIEYSPFTITHT